MSRILVAAAVAVGLSMAGVAHGDFNSAVADYAAQRFDPARAEFESLARLGDGASQFNLGAMYLRGEGVVKDRAIGIGLMLAAAENGYAGVGPEKLAAMQVGLSPDDANKVTATLGEYGKKGLAQRGIPTAGNALASAGGCGAYQWPQPIEIADRATGGTWYKQEGVVLVDVTIGTDGLAHDPEVLLAFPQAFFDKEVVDSYLHSRFKPAMLDGVPVASRMRQNLIVTYDSGGRLWSAGRFARVREAAEHGQTDAQYVVGMAGALDKTLKIEPDHAWDLVLNAAKGGNARAEYMIALQYLPGPGCTGPSRGTLWLEHAVRGGEPSAAFALARQIMSGTPTAADLDRVRSLLAIATSGDAPYPLRHAIALALDPRLQPASATLLAAAAQKLDKSMTGVDPQDYEAIAAAAAVTGDFANAISLQGKAQSKARSLYWNTSSIDARLALYQRQEKFVGDLLELPPTATALPPVRGIKMKNCRDKGVRCERVRADEKEKPLGSNIEK